MELQTFLDKTPYLYHLTDRKNLNAIIKGGRLISTVGLVNMAGMENAEVFLRTRRAEHSVIEIDGIDHYIRDQRPLNRALDKCLTDNWTRGDYIYHLNDRVFLWPNLKRLEIHFGRYEDEQPVIMRFSTGDIFELNDHAEITHINSGATRPSGVFGGKAAPRGKNTFKKIEDFELTAVRVAEVTFPGFCILPASFHIGNSPDGEWEQITLD